MPKTGLKTFVYSFSVSLFAIFAANGVYWHNHSSAYPQVKIPGKNVTLFLKSEPLSPSNLSAPVKKIALSVLPEIKLRQEKLVTADFDDEIIMANVFDEQEEFEEPEIEQKLPKLLANNVSPPQNDAPVIPAQKSPQKPKATVLAAAEKIVIPLEAPKSADIAAVRVVEPASEKQTAPAKLPVQPRSEAVIQTASITDPVPLLPLERGSDALSEAATKVKIGTPGELNQVALADKNIPIRSMEHAPLPNKEKASPQESGWEPMAQKKPDASSPWLVAKANGAVKNTKIAEEQFYNKEAAGIQKALSPKGTAKPGVQVAAETVKNLLIPIPEDILNDENLMPQLSFSPQNKPDEKPEQTAIAPVAETTAIPADPEVQKNKLLSSLNAIFSADTKIKPENKPTEKPSILSEIKKRRSKPSSAGKIMPTEMRLSFQPNRAEISGQTLRWIQAFAAKAADDKSMSIEIRIDGTSAMELQQKRLNLLHNILTTKGVEYSKINTVFTQREPNSFIIKTIVRNNINKQGSNGNINKAAAARYQQW